jgi:hypothetical protein
MMILRRERVQRAEARATRPPLFTSFRERRRWRDEHNIRPCGPQTSEPENPSVPLALSDNFGMADRALLQEHQRTIASELAAIDKRREQIAQVLATDAVNSSSYAHQELRVERTQLGLLRREVERDLGAPAMAQTDTKRAYVRARTKELRELLWHNAEKLRAQGEHRHARLRRIDSLRSRHLAEHELGLRTSLSGF